MNLFITQNSYYFVHRHFIQLFDKEKSKVVYVNERGRGVAKKYIEIIENFGFINTLMFTFLEVLYFFQLFKRQSKLDSLVIDDINLNLFLEGEIETGKYNQIISIGCPCMINSSFQDKFNIRIINLHGGVIPYQKGRFSPIKSINKGHEFLGASLYLISDSFDEGAILSQDYFKLTNTNIVSNYNKVLKLSANLLDLFFQNKIKTIPREVLINLNKGDTRG